VNELLSITLAVLLGIIVFSVFLIASGATARPLFWIGWILVKTFTLGKLPKTSIDDVDNIKNPLKSIVWYLGLFLISVITILFTFK